MNWSDLVVADERTQEMIRIYSPAAVVAALGLVAALSGCQNEPAELEVENAWAKAADSGMTAVFADISNPGGEDITMVSGTTDVAQMVELHEVADGVMREKEGGHVVPAGSTISLMPGGDHIMIMGLNDPLLPGDTITVSIELDNGDVLDITADVRDYQGANEEYHESGDMDMDMDMEHDGEMHQNRAE
jgi:copper(I)-binding protein